MRIMVYRGFRIDDADRHVVGERVRLSDDYQGTGINCLSIFTICTCLPMGNSRLLNDIALAKSTVHLKV